jgi:hypothetical protein
MESAGLQVWYIIVEPGWLAITSYSPGLHLNHMSHYKSTCDLLGETQTLDNDSITQ